jgi:hypothetical protein
MDTAEIQQQGLDGAALGDAIRDARLRLIRQQKELALDDPGETAVDKQQQST